MDISLLLPILVTVLGGYLAAKLKLFFILRPRRTLRMLKDSMKDKSSRDALFLALAGTLGVGNIFGVCTGILLGGAGSVFWLVLSSFFSMIIKYAECVLSADSREVCGGGMHRVLRTCFGRFGRYASSAYALLCLALALFMGSAMQTTAVSGVITYSLDAPPLLVGVLFFAAVFVGTYGGVEKIERITSKVIPLTTMIYILLALGMILVNLPRLPEVVSNIICEAFSPRAAGGGALAFFSSRAIGEGYARGILSNEAGAGTSSLAHSRAISRTPAEAGLAGMLEAFFDTPLLCTLTALSVLCAVPTPELSTSPMSLISRAVFCTYGAFAMPILILCVLIFAYSTVICWYYYGMECTVYLFGERARWMYAPMFFVFILVGALEIGTGLVYITDLILLVMSILTLAAVFVRRDRIKALTREGGLIG